MRLHRLALLFATAFAAGSASAADLLSVYRDAVAADAPYAAARSQLAAGREQLTQGRAGLLPSLSVSANTTWNEVDNHLRQSSPFFPTDTNGKYNSNGWTATLTQPLFRWQNWSGYRQSEFAVAQSEAQFAQARQDLVLRVAQAYFAVLLAEDTLTTSRAQKSAISEQLAAAKRNFEVGTATVTDSQEAQARYDLATSQEIAAESDLQVKREALRAIIGKEPEALKHLKADAQIGRPQPDDIAKWSDAAEQGNPNVAMAQAAAEIADREVDKQRAGHYPTVDFVATRGRSSTGLSPSIGVGSDTTATTIGVQATIPIFSGGATQSHYRQAADLRDKAQADLDNARRQAGLGARQAYLGVSSGLAQVKALEQALSSSQLALDSNKLGYEVGVRINIDVLNAQQQVYSTQRDLAKARLDTLTALLNLKSAAGSLSEDDLAAINALLE
jgi:outer membrane protein